MKWLFIFLIFPGIAFSQEPPRKSYYAAYIQTDSGLVKGFFIDNNDSNIVLSPKKKYDSAQLKRIPVVSINSIHLIDKRVSILGACIITVAGFLLTAGLTQNADYNQDGKLNVLELIINAIEGTTSGDKKRRKTALIAGAAGGTTALIIGIVAKNKLTIRLPFTNRRNAYLNKRQVLKDFIKF